MLSALRALLEHRPGRPALRADIQAGITVGVVALPLSMALAIAVGVPPQHGLYTAVVAGTIIALCGGSAVNVSGPTAAFVVVLLPVTQQFGLGGLLVSGLLAGILLVAMGAARLGSLIEIVPYPVTVGFTAGIAVVIATLQLKDFLGLDTGPLVGHYTDNVGAILGALPGLDWREFAVGLATLAILAWWPRLRTPVPGHLVALAGVSGAVWVLGQVSEQFTVDTIGSRFSYVIDGVSGQGIPPVAPAFLPPWRLPGVDGAPLPLNFDLLRQLLPSALAIAMLGAIESLLCAVVADGMTGKRHNPNDELIGQGLGNIAAPFFGGIPATAAIARTAFNVRAGGRTPLAATTHGLFVLASIVSLAPLLGHIPMASMAALLLMVAWNMSEARHFLRILRIAPGDDIAVLLICFLLTVLFDMTLAVGIGMGLAAALFINRSISLASTRRVESHPELHGELPTGVLVYEIDGPLFFGSAHKAIKSISDVLGEVRVVILDMGAVNMLDMSAIAALDAITSQLEKRQVVLVINNLQQGLILRLRRAGIRRRQGRVYFTRNLADAIGRAQRVLAPAGTEGTP